MPPPVRFLEEDGRGTGEKCPSEYGEGHAFSRVSCCQPYHGICRLAVKTLSSLVPE